jgi:hypothetical protein
MSLLIEESMAPDQKHVTKRCFACGGEFPLSSFYKHSAMADGHLNKCKTCCKSQARRNRRKRVEYYRDYDRARGNRQGLEYTQDYRQRFPLKYKAHCAVNNALRDGRIVKEACCICGNTDTVAHHEDYTKPLNVIWLCSVHHRWIHS